MRTTLISKTAGLAIAVLAVATAASAQSLTPQDRDALIKDLERSRTIFLEAIADVRTEAQWNYKPAPDRWSVGECAAHIIAAEAYFRDNIAATLKTPAVKVADQAKGDAMLSTIVRDRS